MAQYYTILTTAGEAAIANATVTQTKVNITTLAVGDGNGAEYAPTGTETALRRETWRGPTTQVSIDPDNANHIVVNSLIPSAVGGFVIREFGLYDADGTLIAIANYPETYKPIISDGTVFDLSLDTVIEINNVSVVEVVVDPNVITASKQFVKDEIQIYANSVEAYPKFLGEIDDTLRIKRMITASPNGGVFYFPGNYIISDTINFPKNSEVFGDGASLSSIKWNVDNQDAKTMIVFADNTDGSSSIHDIEIDGSRSERGLVDDQSSVGIQPGDFIEIYRTKIHNVIGPGISRSGIRNVTIDNCDIQNNGHHNIYFSTHSTRKYIRNIRITRNFLGEPSAISARAYVANQIKFRFASVTDDITTVRIEDNDIAAPSNNSISIFVSTVSGGSTCKITDVRITNNIFNKLKNNVDLISTVIYIGTNSRHESVYIMDNSIYGNTTNNTSGTFGIRLLGNGISTQIVRNKITNFDTAINGNDVDLYNNFLLDFTRIGISVQNSNVEDNVFTTTYPDTTAVNRCNADVIGNKFDLGGSGTAISMVEMTSREITRNHIKSCASGIARVGGRILTSCTIDANTFDSVTTKYTNLADATTRKDNLINPSTTLRAIPQSDLGVGEFEGEEKFNRTTARPVYWDGTVWRYSDGVAV